MFISGEYKNRSSVILIWVAFLTSNFSIAQSNHLDQFQFISPVPNSKLVSPETNIIIRYGDAFQSSSVNENTLDVVGSISGKHKGKYILSEENKTLIFCSYEKFDPGETVNVKLNYGLKTLSGEAVPPFNFNFRTSSSDLKYELKYVQGVCNLDILEKMNQKNRTWSEGIRIKEIDQLPEDFPDITVNINNNPTDGFIFFSPFSFPGFLPTYLIISDNRGIPVFYRKSTEVNNNFNKLDDGTLCYFNGANNSFVILDSSYKIIDSVRTGNGYLTDVHELEKLPDNHYLLMSYDPQTVRMDTIVAGGDSNAIVIGLIIQELDENKNVVFQWRSWDHMQITDATYNISLTDSIIDYVHGNAIEKDHDGHLLISSRHLDEITKISRQTGEIIWRWGGEHCKNNDFTFLNDPIGFSHQHDIRRLPNGNLTLFDNGNLHDPQFSRAAEYQLDETNMYANLVWEYRTSNQSFSFAMGSTRRLENHNTIIGWGTKNNSPDLSEVTADKIITLAFTFPDTLFNYRAFKYQWETNLFKIEPEYYDFDVVHPNDSASATINLISNSPDTIAITSSYSHSGFFRITSTLPVILPPYGNVQAQIQFKPESEGYFNDNIHIRKETETDLIAQIIKVTGRTDSSIVSANEAEILEDFYLSQNYPNPFNSSTKIRFSIPSNVILSPAVGGINSTKNLTILKIYDVLGNEVATIVNEELSAGEYTVDFDATGLTSGIYFYQLKSGSLVQTKKMILLK